MPLFDFVRFVIELTAFLASMNAASQDEMVVSPPLRLEVKPNNGSYALEYAGVARRVQVLVDGQFIWKNEAVGLWMRVPSQPPYSARTIRRAYTEDAGSNWSFTDFHDPEENPHPPDNHAFAEFDPFAAYDPVSKALIIGAMSFDNSLPAPEQGEVDFVAHRNPGSATWDDHVRFFGPDQFSAAHFPHAAAGSIPEFPLLSRLFVSAGYDLLWSDNLGATWPNPPLDLGGVNRGLPRVGKAGQVYISDDQTLNLLLQRSKKLVTPSEPTSPPEFLTASTVASRPDGWAGGGWVPSTFRVPSYCTSAVAPHDGNRVYAVWPAQSSAQGTQVNVELFFTMTANAIADTVAWDSDPSDPDLDLPRRIPAGMELAGDQFFQWFEASTYMDGGVPKTRLHLMFMDNPAQSQSA